MRVMLCPGCQRRIPFSDEEVGLVFVCAECETRFTPPAPAHEDQSAPRPLNRITRVALTLWAVNYTCGTLLGVALLVTALVVGGIAWWAVLHR